MKDSFVSYMDRVHAEQDLKEKVPKAVVVWVAVKRVPEMEIVLPKVRAKTVETVEAREKGTDHKEVPEY
jgi:hypothetical protein